MKRTAVFRFSVFWVWSITLLFTLCVFIWSLISRAMTFKEIEESLTQVMGLVVPQLSIMTAFFFGASKEAQSRMLERQRGMADFALGLSLFYHVIFWSVIWLAIGAGIFGSTIDENASAAIKILGFVSIFGLSPVAYLFASSVATEA